MVIPRPQRAVQFLRNVVENQLESARKGYLKNPILTSTTNDSELGIINTYIKPFIDISYMTLLMPVSASWFSIPDADTGIRNGEP